MRILALDTATTVTAVGLTDVTDTGDFIEGGLRLSARDIPPPASKPGHATHLLPLINRLMTKGSCRWSQIDRIAVGIGPGTFTGLRIGVATAQALARSQSKPLVGVSTLASLALQARASDPDSALAAVIDARRSEIFAAVWSSKINSIAPPRTPPTVLQPAAIELLLEDHTTGEAQCLAFGDGAIKFRQLLEEAGAEVPSDESLLHLVDAVWHCCLGAVAGPRAPHEVQPEYLRVPDAELAK